MKKFAVIVAGGSGSRMKSSVPKQFLEINGIPILIRTLLAYREAVPSVGLVVVLPADYLEQGKQLCMLHIPEVSIQFSEGGQTRFHSVQNGLKWVEEGALVAIHDAVRPLVSPNVIRQSFEVAAQKGSAIATVALKDSIRKVEGKSSTAVDRSIYRMVQTPQTFRVDLIKNAGRLVDDPKKFTDDASVFEHAGHAVTLIEGNYENIKITTPEDLIFASAYLQQQPNVQP